MVVMVVCVCVCLCVCAHALARACMCVYPRIRLDLEKFKDPKTAEVIQGKMGGKFASLFALDRYVDSLGNSVKVLLSLV